MIGATPGTRRTGRPRRWTQDTEEWTGSKIRTWYVMLYSTLTE